MNQTTSPQSITAHYAPSIDLKQYARLLWRWSWLVVICALLAGAAAYMVSINTVPVYRSSNKLMINEARNGTTTNYSDILASERAARTYAELLKRPSTLRTALVQLGLDPDSGIAGQISAVNVSPVRDTQLVNLTVEGTNPQLLAAVANSLPQVFVAELRQVQSGRFADSKSNLEDQLEQFSLQIEKAELQLAELEARTRTAQEEIEYNRLSNSITQYQSSYANVLQSYETLRLAEVQSIDNIAIMEPAKVPSSPIRPRTLTNTLLAMAVGAMLALGTIFLIEFLDDRIRTPDDLRRVADIPVLGTIGKSPGKNAIKEGPESLISVTQPRHPIVEAYRRLRTNLQFYNVDTELKSMVVTSANAGEGKSTSAANLAVVMAQSGLSVILVDADLRKPTQHHRFGLSRKPGLSEALLAPNPYHISVPIPKVPNLRVMTCGEKVPNPAEILGSKRMKQMVEELHQYADVIIFDTPPLMAVTDAQVVGRYTDGVIVVIDTQATSGGAVHRALESLVQVNVPIMGAVLNRMTNSARGYYYYYTNDYYYSDSDDDGGSNKPGPDSQQEPARKGLLGGNLTEQKSV